jgi:hypothetical protein
LHGHGGEHLWPLGSRCAGEVRRRNWLSF